jgi:hypothetical protein
MWRACMSLLSFCLLVLTIKTSPNANAQVLPTVRNISELPSETANILNKDEAKLEATANSFVNWPHPLAGVSMVSQDSGQRGLGANFLRDLCSRNGCQLQHDSFESAFCGQLSFDINLQNSTIASKIGK